MKIARIAKIAIGFVGTLALLAALHHIVVVNARGTAFSNAFAGTCSWCHGDRYDGFGQAAAAWQPFWLDAGRHPAKTSESLAGCTVQSRVEAGRCLNSRPGARDNPLASFEDLRAIGDQTDIVQAPSIRAIRQAAAIGDPVADLPVAPIADP